jgi:hypothetical protein
MPESWRAMAASGRFLPLTEGRYGSIAALRDRVLSARADCGQVAADVSTLVDLVTAQR